MDYQRLHPVIRLGSPLLLALLPWPDLRGVDLILPPALESASRNSGTLKQLDAVKFYGNYEPHPDPLQAINLPALLAAISAIESSNNDKAIGRRGERGRYQITSSVWASFGRGIFAIEAHKPEPAKDCAIRYLKCLARTLLDHNIVPNVTDLATLWNQGTLLHGASDYSERVTTYYYDAIKSQTPVPSAPILSSSNHRRSSDLRRNTSK